MANPIDQFLLGGDMAVRRMGFGAMQLTGPGVWGPQRDREQSIAVLRRAVELGVNFIDTADVYGPGDNEKLIAEALGPYPAGLVIATKGGLVRSGPATRENPGISMNGTDAHIRRAVEGSLRDLGLERIDLYQLHRIDPAVPIEDTMGTFKALQTEGKIRHIGLSEVSVADIERARSVVDIATVQNVYNVAVRRHDDVLAYCGKNNIGFIPFWPLHVEAAAAKLATLVADIGVTREQVALAWLLRKSRATILIPGTSSLLHLEQNLAARALDLSASQFEALDQISGS